MKYVKISPIGNLYHIVDWHLTEEESGVTMCRKDINKVYDEADEVNLDLICLACQTEYSYREADSARYESNEEEVEEEREETYDNTNEPVSAKPVNYKGKQASW